MEGVVEERKKENGREGEKKNRSPVQILSMVADEVQPTAKPAVMDAQRQSRALSAVLHDRSSGCSVRPSIEPGLVTAASLQSGGAMSM